MSDHVGPEQEFVDGSRAGCAMYWLDKNSRGFSNKTLHRLTQF